MPYFLRIKLMSGASDWTREAMSVMPARSEAWEAAKASRDAASAVSSTVPSTSTTRMSRSVWYVFCLTPQHMPDELLATMPPIMQDSMDAGSGPILYWVESLCFFLYAASRRFTSPPIRPGSRVIVLPSSSIWYLRHALPLWLSFMRTESVMAWPEREVPAARNVTGVSCSRAFASVCTTSSSVKTRTTACGLSR